MESPLYFLFDSLNGSSSLHLSLERCFPGSESFIRLFYEPFQFFSILFDLQTPDPNHYPSEDLVNGGGWSGKLITLDL